MRVGMVGNRAGVFRGLQAIGGACWRPRFRHSDRQLSPEQRGRAFGLVSP
jgi:hypothetical protein